MTKHQQMRAEAHAKASIDYGEMDCYVEEAGFMSGYTCAVRDAEALVRALVVALTELSPGAKCAIYTRDQVVTQVRGALRGYLGESQDDDVCHVPQSSIDALKKMGLK